MGGKSEGERCDGCAQREQAIPVRFHTLTRNEIAVPGRSLTPVLRYWLRSSTAPI